MFFFINAFKFDMYFIIRVLHILVSSIMHCYAYFINVFVLIFQTENRGQLSRTYGQRQDESIESTRKKLNVTNTMD